MKKKYRKPMVFKREQNRVHSGSGVRCYSSGCGKLIVGATYSDYLRKKNFCQYAAAHSESVLAAF